jgi:hypothetical protein
MLLVRYLSSWKFFYDATVVLSGVYYPTSPLVLHHMIEMITHLHECEKDQNLFVVVYPMKLKFLKYWKEVPMLYSIAFVLDPRGKMRGLFNVLQILQEKTGVDYNSYYANVKAFLYKLFNQYEVKYGAARTQRKSTQPARQAGKRKHSWGMIFGGPGGSGVVGPSPANSPSLSAAAVGCELTAYLDSDNVTAYEEEFDLLLWWRDHKLTFPVLSIMARDIMSVPVSTVSSESTFSLTGRIIEERRRRLLPEHVEMLACIKDWELGDKRLQHDAIVVDNQAMEESFKNLYLDEDATGTPSTSTTASASVASASGT